MKSLEKENVKQRTQALIDQGRSLEEMICWTATDYMHALKNKPFCEHWGGVDAFRAELEQLLDLYHAQREPTLGEALARFCRRWFRPNRWAVLSARVRPS